MPRAADNAVTIMFALGAHGKAAQAVAAAYRAKALSPSREQLMHVNLVADIPDKLVFGRIEDVVQRDGELDDAKIGAEVPAVPGQTSDHFGPDFIGQHF